jgi:predicted TIM-barrel enzyme
VWCELLYKYEYQFKEPLGKQEILRRLHKKIEEKKPIIYVGAELGIIGKWAEIGGADLVGFAVTGWRRLQGLPTMDAHFPTMDANAVLLEWGPQLINAVAEVPVLANVFSIDRTRNMRYYLQQLKAIGYAGVSNYPWFVIASEKDKAIYKRGGIDFSMDCGMFRIANELDLLTRGYGSTKEEMRMVAEVPCDIVSAHIGLTAHPYGAAWDTTGGTATEIDLREKTIEEATAKTQELLEAALDVNPEAILMLHGGLASTPENVKYILDHTSAHGFVGALVFDQTPIEKAVKETVEKYSSIRIEKVARRKS